MSPTVTIVVPVFNRDAELDRALRSIQRQTFEGFECIVVDDASDIPIRPIIEGLDDERFRYLRNEQNRGPYNARVQGLRSMRGEIMIGVDSDWEPFPWMVERAVTYLRDFPEVDGVAGLHLNADTGRLFVRVKGGQKVLRPEEYLRRPLGRDCVGAVRRVAVDEWLEKRDDYFALEMHQWLTFHMRHCMLFVDEPWGKCHVDSPSRVTVNVDDRRLDDYLKFVDEHRAEVEGLPARVIDDILEQGWRSLLRAGRRKDAARLAALMRQRGVSRRGATVRGIVRKVRRVRGAQEDVVIID